jgi:hypothetical protein
MFIVEMIAGFSAGSVSLQADSLDFLSDTVNYGISLLVAGMALRNRARAAFGKGVTMGLFGIWVLASSVWKGFAGAPPEAVTMGVVWRRRTCRQCPLLRFAKRVPVGRQQYAIGLAVLAQRSDRQLRGAGVGDRRCPDRRRLAGLLVAAIMAVLALQGAAVVVTQARAELTGAAA